MTNIKYFQFAVVALLAITLCGCDKSAEQNIPAGLGQDASLVVTPKQASKDETVKLTFPAVHPQNIAIKSPSGDWYTIHNGSESILLMPDSEFKSATSLQLKLSSVTGTKWIDGKAITEPVFTRPGKYLIYMANNLETEPENTFFISSTIDLK